MTHYVEISLEKEAKFKAREGVIIIDIETPMQFYSVRPKATFLIAAPKADMIQYTNEVIIDGEIKAIQVPDPIVLFPIENDCYLIVTAWGDEASDPIVFNEQLN